MYLLHVTKHLEILCNLIVRVDLQIFYIWWDLIMVTTIPDVGYVDLFLIRPTNNKNFTSTRLIGNQYMYPHAVLTM